MDSPLALEGGGYIWLWPGRPFSVCPSLIGVITVSLETDRRGLSTLQGAQPAFGDSPRGHTTAPGEAQRDRSPVKAEPLPLSGRLAVLARTRDKST